MRSQTDAQPGADIAYGDIVDTIVRTDGIDEIVTPVVRNINPGKAWGFSKVIQFCPRDFLSHTSRSTGFGDLGIKPNRRPSHNKEKG